MRGLEIFFIITVSLLISSISSQLIESKINTQDIQKVLEFVKRSWSNKFNHFLEHKLRQMMINGDEKLHLPVIDPLRGHDQQFDFKIDDTEISVQIDEYHLEGISSYVVKGSSINALKRRIDISMNFPTITAHGLYNLDGFVNENTPVFGYGDFNITCKDFYYSAVAYVSIFGGVHVKSLDLKINLRAINLLMTGLMNDDQSSSILSEVFSDMIPKMIIQYHDKIVAIASEKVIKIINKMIEGKSLHDLLGLLT